MSSNDAAASEVAPKVVIKKAVKEDVPEIYAMIRELAEYEKDLPGCKATLEQLYISLGFTGGPAYAQTLMVFVDEKAVGMALFFYNFSTWTAKPGVYLEDLFVREKYRKHGYGTALLAALAREVRRIDGGRLDWQVLNWNKPSIDFYKSIGAKTMDDWLNMRVEGDGLDKLGEKGPKIDVLM